MIETPQKKLGEVRGEGTQRLLERCAPSKSTFMGGVEVKPQVRPYRRSHTRVMRHSIEPTHPIGHRTSGKKTPAGTMLQRGQLLQQPQKIG
ncbi:hypothetical protein TNCT_399001 [Trichonephila clavata]|uniref:Uncharacterized protein n=1 Tax=Trichonephila clavata TaxID=2740835 RepID=A0A8X6FQ52_TRICU|nr:hypothetical protein TNCT_399001 [Trichonephila clavata]